MQEQIRIGNAHGFWGDRIEAAAEMLAADPDLDFLTLDFLAEVSMSIMAAQQKRDANAGYARDFLVVLETLRPYFQRGCPVRIVTNAGGLNPMGCAVEAQLLLERMNCTEKKIAVVSGDDVTALLRGDSNRQQAERYERGNVNP